MRPEKTDFRKRLNQQARESVKGSIHQHVKLIVHRPEAAVENEIEYRKQVSGLMPVIRELSQKTMPLLEHETA